MRVPAHSRDWTSLSRAEPLLLPLGQLLSTYDAGRAWPEHRTALVRVGYTPYELDEQEYRMWMLAHSVAERPAGQRWTLARATEFGPRFGVKDVLVTAGRLLERRLLARVALPDYPDFARSVRLVASAAGSGNRDRRDRTRFRVGEGADLNPELWQVWRWSATDADLAATCEYLTDDNVDALLQHAVDGLHTVLAHGAGYLDERWHRPALSWDAPPLLALPADLDTVATSPVFAIGHDAGAVYSGEGTLQYHAVRVGREELQLDEPMYRTWRAASGLSTLSKDSFGLEDLFAKVAGEGPDGIEELLELGALVPACDVHAFAARYRLRNLGVGLGYQPDGWYGLGRFSYEDELIPVRRALVLPAEVDVWQWAGECASLAEAADLLAKMNRGRGETAPGVATAGGLLPHLYRTARHLMALNSAYLDNATG